MIDWNKEKDDIIRNAETLDEAVERLGFSRPTVTRRARILGVSLAKPHAPRRKRWTHEMDNFILNHSIRESAEKLRMSRPTIIARKRELEGVTRLYLYNVSIQLHSDLKELAEKSGMNLSEYLVHIVTKHVKTETSCQ